MFLNQIMDRLFPLPVDRFFSADSLTSEEYDVKGSSMTSESLDCVELLSELSEGCFIIFSPVVESNDLEHDVE